MIRAARCALRIALVGACIFAFHFAAAQDRRGEQQAMSSSTQKAPGTLEILLGRKNRQQARGTAAANSNVTPGAAALRPDRQPIATGVPGTATRGEPSHVARNSPEVALSTNSSSDAGSAPTRANSLGRDAPATSLGQADSSATDLTVASPAPQK